MRIGNKPVRRGSKVSSSIAVRKRLLRVAHVAAI